MTRSLVEEDVNPTRRNVVGDRHEMDAESNNG